MGATVPSKGLIKGDVFMDTPIQYKNAECPDVLKMVIPLCDLIKVKKELSDKYSIYSLYNKAIVEFYKVKK